MEILLSAGCMKNSKKLWRALLFVLLIAAFCGSFAFPLLSRPANAAPRMQATSCLGTTFAQWTFNNVTTPSLGAGTFSQGSGLSAPSFGAGSPDPGVSFTNWTTSTSRDTTDYVDFSVPTIGRNSIQLNFDYRATGTGPQNLEIDYSLDGTNFTPLGSPQPLTRDSNYHSLTFDFSSITALNDIANAVFRIYGYGAGGNNGRLNLDNVSFAGTCINPADTETATSPPTAVTERSLLISEVAWSGTAASSNDEWFELHNVSGADINLNGWRLTADDGNPDIALSGTISANDPFFVVARNATIFQDLQPDLTYPSGAFSNDGEILILTDPSGNQVDTANLDGGNWNAGQGAPSYASMERQRRRPDGPDAWATYSGTIPIAHDRNGNNIKGTPGQTNWVNLITATPSPTATGTQTNTPPISSIIINEVAWMGTGASADDEWIELYNPGGTSVTLVGWELRGADGAPIIELSGTIPAGGFFLLERSDDNTVSDAPANQIYTGELENTGETLYLYDASVPSRRLVDSANWNGGNWPAGTTTTLGSMERRGLFADSDTAWITNVQSSSWRRHDARGTGSTNYLIHGTPGYANWAFTVTPTASPLPTVTPRRTPTRTLTPPPPPPLVAINEFVPRPGRDWNNDGAVNVDDEYIELLNHGTVNVNLSGYTLDDEVNIGSTPYRLPSVTLRPGERYVFYGGETGLLLSDGGDGVRLLQPNGQLADAYNYSVVGYPDQSFCRLPDNGGADDWNQSCFPTPGLQNSLSGESAAPSDDVPNELYCPIADTLPSDFALAECEPYGNEIWSSEFWDSTGWYGEKYLPEIDSKWPVFAD